MPVTTRDYAFVGLEYELTSGADYKKFTAVEYTGSNATDVATWGASFGGGTVIFEDSGALKVRVRAYAGPWVWASKFQGREVVAEVPSGSFVVVQGSTFMGVLHPDYMASNFAELA